MIYKALKLSLPAFALFLASCSSTPDQMVIPEASFVDESYKPTPLSRAQQNLAEQLAQQTPVYAQKGKIFMRRTDSGLPEGTKLGRVQAAASAGDWIPIEDARIVVHTDKLPLQDLVKLVMRQVAAQSGPWDLKFKLSRDSEDVLFEPFSLNTETTFGEFVNAVSEYLMNYRGIDLKFHLFKQTRVLVVTDA